jgi:protein KRI1
MKRKTRKQKPNSSQKKTKKNESFEDIGIYEDLIGGDIPTRYKYRVVEANDFGLTDEEIMFADDKELNKWCSIKKMSQYRNDDEEKYDIKSYSNKANDLELKKKILKSFYSEQNGNEVNSEVINTLSANNNKKKRKKRRHKKPTFIIEPINKSNENLKHENQNNVSVISNKRKPNKKLKRVNKKLKRVNKKLKPSLETSVSGVSVERLKAYGLSNREIKKVKNKIK